MGAEDPARARVRAAPGRRGDRRAVHADAGRRGRLRGITVRRGILAATLAGMSPADGQPPRIVVTVADPARDRDPDLAERRNARYLEALGRHGAATLALSSASSDAQRTQAL